MVNISKIGNVITPKYEALAKNVKPVGSQIDRALECAKTLERDRVDLSKVTAKLKRLSVLKRLKNRLFG